MDGQHQDVDRTLRGRVNQNDRGLSHFTGFKSHGEGTSMVWPTLGSRTAKEQEQEPLSFFRAVGVGDCRLGAESAVCEWLVGCDYGMCDLASGVASTAQVLSELANIDATTVHSRADAVAGNRQTCRARMSSKSSK